MTIDYTALAFAELPNVRRLARSLGVHGADTLGHRELNRAVLDAMRRLREAPAGTLPKDVAGTTPA